MKKHAKQKPTALQNRIDGLTDVYVGGKLILTCKETDLCTQQVKYLIQIANGTIQSYTSRKFPQKK